MHVALPCIVLRLGFKALDFTVSIRTWFLFYAGSTFIALLDVATDSVFAGRAMRRMESEGAISHFWEISWSSSLVSSLPVPSLWFLVLLSWYMSLLQMIIPFLRTLQRGDFTCATMYRVGYMGEKNLLFNFVLYALADASGITAIQSVPLQFQLHWIEEFVHTVPSSIISDSADEQERIVMLQALGKIRAFQEEVSLIGSQVMERVYLSYLLETAFQVNLQCTYYTIGLARERIHGETNAEDWETLLSMVACLVGIAPKIADLRYFWRLLLTADDLASRCDVSEHQDIQHSLKARKQKARMICCGVLLLLLAILNVACKLVMAHVCEDAIWNWNGCVVLPG